MLGKTMQIILVILLFWFAKLSDSWPLSTRSGWIIDKSSGHRFKLRCVNWAAHLQPMIAEGLNKKPSKDIASHIVSNGFNCVRLTWATHMFTRYSNLTVAQSLDRLALKEVMAGVAKNNGVLLNSTLVDAYEMVIDDLGFHNVAVVLDNHISEPKWCCSNDDGNGFFGDENFDPNEWLQGLAIVANRFKDKPMVVAMSMRNELRGPKQNQNDWYRYIQEGATTIHGKNPHVLVIVSGLNYGTDLSFIKERPLELKLKNKLVYEAHWYSFDEQPPEKWLEQPYQVCANETQRFINQAGFLVQGENPVPLFLSEFGVDERGVNGADNLFLGCLLALVAEMDLDWALWALQGSYYLRDGLIGPEETYGLLDANWDHIRNPKIIEGLQLVQQILRDKKSHVKKYYIMYHPQSGHCIRVDKKEMYASDCRTWSRWSYKGAGTPIRLMGTSWCLKAVGDGLPVILSIDCKSEQSRWEFASSSKFQIAARDEHGIHLCLEWNPIPTNSSNILTKKCLCSEDESQCHENPQSQWFKLISSNSKQWKVPEVNEKRSSTS
uniref:Putative endoglucanase E1-like n=1 Tax=Davidia involucrata TaxID=16924 RepID=A0A5B7AH14_DAVIN